MSIYWRCLRPPIWWQETQLSLTDHATYLWKCNDVDDQTSIIKIRLKKNLIPHIGLSRSLKVIGTDTNRHAIYDFLLVFSSNFIPKTHRFRDIRLQKCLEIRVRGPSMSLDLSPFDRAHVTSFWRFKVMALSRAISGIFIVEKCDLEIRVRGHSRSSKVVSFDRLCMSVRCAVFEIFDL